MVQFWSSFFPLHANAEILFSLRYVIITLNYRGAIRVGRGESQFMYIITLIILSTLFSVPIKTGIKKKKAIVLIIHRVFQSGCEVRLSNEQISLK